MANVLKAKTNAQFRVVLNSDYLRDGYSWCLTKLPESAALYSQENVHSPNRPEEVDQIFTFIALEAGETSIEFVLLRKTDPADKKETLKIPVEIAALDDTGIGSDRFLDYDEALAVYKRPDNDLPIRGTNYGSVMAQPCSALDGACNLAYMNAPRSGMDGCCAPLYRVEVCSNMDGACAPAYFKQQSSELDGYIGMAYRNQPRSILNGSYSGFYGNGVRSGFLCND